MFDGKAFGAEIVGIVKGHVERSLAPLNARLDAMEKAIASLPIPKDGKDADVAEVAALAAERILTELKELRSVVEAIPEPIAAPELPDIPAMIADAVQATKPEPVDTKALVDEVTAAVMEAMKALLPDHVGKLQVEDMISRALADLPKPDLSLFDTVIGEKIAALPPAEKGKDADPVEVATQIAVEVERAVAGLPAPQDGKSVTVDELLPTVTEAVAKAVAALPVAKDGIDAVDVMIDREGSLVFTMSDGRMKNVGQVVGRDGVDVDMMAVAKAITEQVAAIPKPKDGIDGVGFDDLDVVDADEGVLLRFARGEVVKEWRLPVMRYRGVFKDGQVYRRGDTVTWGGSLWHCDADGTDDKPDGETKSWTLASKRGRDGKDATAKAPIKPGSVKVS